MKKLLSLLFCVILCFLNSIAFASENRIKPASDTLRILEKVYLHTDRSKYTTGENIWFKAYLVDGMNESLSDHSNNLHVELISPAAKIKESRIIRMFDGLGNGDMRIPENLHSGHYRLRAYTNYMRNFSDSYFFSKEISIFNPSDSGRILRDSALYVAYKPDIDFFPEGGSLVDNVTSDVAFKAVDGTGKGIDVSGNVYSSEGELITSLTSTHKGMGKFSLMPRGGLTYLAIACTKNGDTIRKALPRSFSEGLVLHIAGNSDKEIDLIIRTNKKTLDLYMDEDLNLIISRLGVVSGKISFLMKSLNNHLLVNADSLSCGIHELTLTGQDERPLCERLFFLAGDEDRKVNIEINKETFNQRDPVDINISVPGVTGYNEFTFLSLSAYNTVSSDENTGFPSSISSWFLLQSDVRGSIEDPSWYFDQSNPGRLNDLDLLLLTQGWRDFEWKYKKIAFEPETGFTVSGRARKKFANQPLTDSKVNLGIFGESKPVVRIAELDSTGRFSVDNLDINGKVNLIASITGDNDKLKGWLMIDSLKYLPAPVPVIKKQLASALKESAADSGKVVPESFQSYVTYFTYRTSIQKKFRLSDTLNVGEVTITARRQLKPESPQARSERYLMTNQPDVEYKFEPETRMYNNVGFLLKNKFRIYAKDDPTNASVLPRLGTGGGFSSSSVFDDGGAGKGNSSPSLSLASSKDAGEHSSIAPKNPIIMLDGMVVDWESVAFLPIDWVERIDMLNHRHGEMIWGDKGKYGVISVITKPWSDVPNKVFHSVNMKIKGFDEPKIFYSPKHITKLESDYKPDLRTTIFWEPNIKVEADKDVTIKYFNADSPATIHIVVEGITSDGIPVTGSKEYTVQ